LVRHLHQVHHRAHQPVPAMMTTKVYLIIYFLSPLARLDSPPLFPAIANSGLLWRVYELPEASTRELVAGRMASIVGHLIEGT
jgi:hypothetical protein